VDTTNYMTKNV